MEKPRTCCVAKLRKNQAQDFLVSHALKPVSRNYRCKQGELELT